MNGKFDQTPDLTTGDTNIWMSWGITWDVDSGVSMSDRHKSIEMWDDR